MEVVREGERESRPSHTEVQAHRRCSLTLRLPAGVEERYLSEQVRRHARAGPREVNQRLQHLLLVQQRAHLGTVVRLVPTRLVKQGELLLAVQASRGGPRGL